jgi:hypothetical protein
MGENMSRGRNPFYSLVMNLSSRRNSRLFGRLYTNFQRVEGARF